jgi:hypothetical protein
MTRALLVVSFLLDAGLPAASGQFSEAELRAATISMTREGKCLFGLPDPRDLGQCPTYSVAIAGDGTVTYQGRVGVKTIGKRTHKASVDELRKLIAEFTSADFFSLRDNYSSIELPNGLIQVRDHGIATTLTLSIGGRSKSVYEFFGAPDVVKRLGERVDEVADSPRYTGRPRRFKRDLVGDDARTVPETGWALAATDFDVFVTGDRNLSFQQDIGRFKLGVVVLVAELLDILAGVVPGQIGKDSAFGRAGMRCGSARGAGVIGIAVADA